MLSSFSTSRGHRCRPIPIPPPPPPSSCLQLLSRTGFQQYPTDALRLFHRVLGLSDLLSGCKWPSTTMVRVFSSRCTDICDRIYDALGTITVSASMPPPREAGSTAASCFFLFLISPFRYFRAFLSLSPALLIDVTQVRGQCGSRLFSPLPITQ